MHSAKACPSVAFSQDIEEFLEQGVYLELNVQCAAAWRDSKDSLVTFGYSDPLFI